VKALFGCAVFAIIVACAIAALRPHFVSVAGFNDAWSLLTADMGGRE
jgi:hypothetical protein